MSPCPHGGCSGFVTLGWGGHGLAQKLVSCIHAICGHDHQIGFALKKDDITLSGSRLPVCPHTHSAQQALPTPTFLRPRPCNSLVHASFPADSGPLKPLRSNSSRHVLLALAICFRRDSHDPTARMLDAGPHFDNLIQGQYPRNCMIHVTVTLTAWRSAEPLQLQKKTMDQYESLHYKNDPRSHGCWNLRK